MEIKNIWPGRLALGEGPMWHPQEKVLYFFDIAEWQLYRFDPKTGEHQSWSLPDFIGSVVPRKQGGIVATVGQDVVAIEIPSGKITRLAKIIPDNRPDLRMNDGKCDRLGRFWIGVANINTKNPQGGLFRLDPDGTVTQMESAVTVSNGLGWSPDDKTFYYTDGYTHGFLYAYDFNLAEGTISNRRILAKSQMPVEPDGLTVDSAGFIYQAMWNGWKIVRYTSDGKINQEIGMPVERPTSCIFGGEELDTLFITSCSRSLDELLLLPEPAGSLFAIKMPVKGLPEHAFAG